MGTFDLSQALYINDPYCDEFTATIVETQQLSNGRYAIILDKTYFYPTGGGQEHDKGTICESSVLDVVRDDKTWIVKHIIENNLPAGPALCKIDWEHRLRNMQHHSGQHLLSQTILRLYELKTVSANINGYTPSTLDVMADRLLSEEEIENIEDLANQVIYENRQIKTYFIDPAEVDKIPIRRPPKVSENIRIVEIEGYDYSACGGTHCTRTGEIGMLKILKNERVNNKTRIHFIAGYQALTLFRLYYNMIKTMAIDLHTQPQEMLKTINALVESNKTYQKENRFLRHEIITREAKSLLSNAELINGKRFVQFSFESKSANELRILAEEFLQQEDTLAILTSFDGSKLSLIVVCGEDTQNDASLILRRICSEVKCQGGGDHQIAQGGGIIERDNLSRLEKLINQIAAEIL